MDRLGLRGLRGAHRGPEVTADTEEAPELALRRGQCPGQGQELSLRAPLTRAQGACPGLDTRGRARAIPELVSGVRAGPRPWHCQATTAQGSWMGPPGPGPLQPRPSPHPTPLRHRDRNQGPGRSQRVGGVRELGCSESWGVRELEVLEDGHLHERPLPLSGYEEGKEQCGDALLSCGASDGRTP